jgi:ABC-type polar amino acid transport system ATPase subunit
MYPAKKRDVYHMNILRARKIEKSFGEQKVLHDVTFNIHEQERIIEIGFS